MQNWHRNVVRGTRLAILVIGETDYWGATFGRLIYRQFIDRCLRCLTTYYHPGNDRTVVNYKPMRTFYIAVKFYHRYGKVFRIGTVRYHWPMSVHASQAFSIASCTDSEDLPRYDLSPSYIVTELTCHRFDMSPIWSVTDLTCIHKKCCKGSPE